MFCETYTQGQKNYAIFPEKIVYDDAPYFLRVTGLVLVISHAVCCFALYAVCNRTQMRHTAAGPCHRLSISI